ncbi:hypothetical protein BHE97_05750 [Aeromicrobium sp. PE09-221]|uniref:hypothetical protein n=1 Tax=Aeromicrobium sp. PE09-221 TaxID=1898043 RepID=UPI000B3EA8AB|nr:hypothetical protein [Aeromicrobium sp. PE09-221]OUZ11339.1 hypothetical protein BHE97_05750 [Aeromicrobium sp. PE09-221]
MIIVALLLASVGAADLVRRPAGGRLRALELPFLAALSVYVLGGSMLGLERTGIWTLIPVMVLVMLWLTAQHRQGVSGPLVLAAGLVVALLFGQHVPRTEPPIGSWYAGLEIPPIEGLDVDVAALGLGVVLFLLQSANVIVRAVLRRAGPAVLEEERELQGGRILGPIERVFIFAMALAGQYAAVAAVMAAKGVLRFPEISRDPGDGTRAEYVLVGSFVSWGLAFAAVPLF